jgi:hypothetical protein
VTLAGKSDRRSVVSAGDYWLNESARPENQPRHARFNNPASTPIPKNTRFRPKTTYHPHTGYQVITEAGKLWNYVPNHTGIMDESPAVVRIPAGNYKLLAQADRYGRVTVPVVVKEDKLTEVKLQTWGRKTTPATNEAAVVRLPNGHVVGWRATAPTNSNMY